MKDFLYFPSMTKGSLALLYFPGSNPRIALQALWNRMKAIKCHKVS